MQLCVQLALLTLKIDLVSNDGGIQAQIPNSCVDQSLISEIYGCLPQGSTMEEIVKNIRTKTVPTGYYFHSWIPGKSN